MEFDFRDYRSLKEFFKSIYYKNISIKDAEMKQEKLSAVLDALKNCLLDNAKGIYDRREMIINVFNNKVYPMFEHFGDSYNYDGQRSDTSQSKSG